VTAAHPQTTAAFGSISARCATALATLAPGDIPGQVLDEAKLHLLDTIGCGLAALALGKGSYARAAAHERGATGSASAIGVDFATDAEQAALVNGALAHALDFDDTHAGAVAHPSAPVAAATLALGEERGSSGAETIAAFVLGCEVAIRIGMVAPQEFNTRGFHATPLCGVFGATAATARLRGLGPDQIRNALGVAGSFASGILECMVDGTDPKGLHAGWAAQAAITATRLAANGATGPARVFEGRHGFFGAFLAEPGADASAHYAALAEEQFADLGERWETVRTAFKPYPACHAVHAAIDATAAALRELEVGAEQIDEILVLVPEGAVPMVLEPLAPKQRPTNGYAAKFSLPYSIASMAVTGRVDLTTYAPPALEDGRVLALASRVRYETRDFPTYPGYFPAEVRIRLLDGRQASIEVERQRGGPESPLPDGAVLVKYRSNAELALPEAAASDLQRSIIGLESEVGLAALATLRQAQPMSIPSS
jgi:2-methylcitrate dehydratase PrpD